VTTADTIGTDLLRAEWTKLRTVRSTVWSLGATIVVTLGIMILATSVYTTQFAKLPPEEQAHMRADAIGLILQPGAAYGQIGVCVLGVMVIAGEYASGMIRASILAAPRRLPLLAAKGLIFAALVFVVGELLAFTAFFVGAAVLHKHLTVSLGDPGVLRAIIGLGLYLSTVGLLALAAGALIRHTAGAITTVLAVVLVLNGLAGLLPGDTGRYVSAYLPSNAGAQILTSGRWPGEVLTPWQGYGILCAWTVLLLALAGWLLKRRDA
jgi:ABC-type transport system involved in multi-copper enzyme maturation permease subunit